MDIQSHSIPFTFTLDDALTALRAELRSKGFEEVKVESTIAEVSHALVTKQPGYNARGKVEPLILLSGTCRLIPVTHQR